MLISFPAKNGLTLKRFEDYLDWAILWGMTPRAISGIEKAP